MDAWDMAAAIAFILNKDSWVATASLDEIDFMNEDGERFRLTVEALDEEKAA